MQRNIKVKNAPKNVMKVLFMINEKTQKNKKSINNHQKYHKQKREIFMRRKNVKELKGRIGE